MYRQEHTAFGRGEHELCDVDKDADERDDEQCCYDQSSAVDCRSLLRLTTAALWQHSHRAWKVVGFKTWIVHVWKVFF